MAKNSFIFSSDKKPKLPSAFLITLVWILFQETFGLRILLSQLSPYYNSTDFPVWEFKTDLAEKQTPSYEILFLGDSRIFGGVDAKSFQDATHRTTLNLALPGMQAPGHYFLLRRYLAHHPKPQLIFYSPTPFMLNEVIEDFSDRTFRWFIQGNEMAELMPDLARIHGKAKKPLIEFVAKYLLPTYSRRYQLQGFFEELLRGELPQRLETNNKIREHIKNQNGFMMHGQNIHVQLEEGAITQAYQEAPNNISRFIFEPSHLNTHYLEKIIRLCKSKDIRIILFFGPEPEEMQSLRDEIGFNKHLREYAKELEIKNPEMELGTPLLWSYQNSFFMDQVHLNAAGAQRFTRDLMEVYGFKTYSGKAEEARLTR